ncbi:MAG TPA: hypothetical protein VFQ25_13750 [Ktedonobacterales bacterium]|nr:hypothetical protein [Ktedonobacterales bacterium]
MDSERVENGQFADTINNNNITLDAAGMLALVAGNAEGALGSQAATLRTVFQNLLGLYAQKPQPGSSKAEPEASAGQSSEPNTIPATEQELRAWFHRLSAMERCQVRATAILHGAPTHIISSATAELYAACFPNARAKAKDEPHEREKLHVGDTILEHALTKVRFVNGAQRLYWMDVDSDGQSEFGIRALNLVADEISGVAGLRTENALPVIEKWVASGRAEVSARAAYAQGVIWRRLDHERLRSTVRLWARSPNESLRVCAAVMALGAFFAEHEERAKQAATPGEGAAAPQPAIERIERYDTLRLLARMGSDAQGPAQPGVDRGLFAVAVSAAYSLIGLGWPDHAVDGLDRLLGLAPAYDYETPHVIPGYVCLPAALAYAELAAAGRVRQTLARLGAHARRLGRKPDQPPVTEAMRERDSRRKDRLFNTVLAFALTTAAAGPASRRAWTRYGASDHLEDSPAFDAHAGRDVLLDGLLSSGETELQFDVQSLLWASMTGDTADLAKQTLGLWANRVAQATIEAPDSCSSEAFVRFLVTLDAFIAQRDTLAHYSGLGALGALGAPRARYRRLLTDWSNSAALDEKKRRVSAMARDALAAMPAL